MPHRPTPVAYTHLTTVITLVNSFHGRTIATLTATGQEVFHNYLGPFNEGFLYLSLIHILFL